MIAGIFLGVFSVILFIAAGIGCRRAVAATAPPPIVWREWTPPKLPALPPPIEPEPSMPDEWDMLMADVRRAVDEGRL